MSNVTRIALCFLTLLASRVLDAAPLPGFVLSTRTSRIVFYARNGMKVDALRTERYLEDVEKLLGHRIERAEYYRYGSAQEIGASTGSFAEGITYARAGQIHSVEAFHAHEVVHLVAGQLGDPGRFFQEGLAVALGDGARWRGRDVHKLARAAARTARISSVAARFDQVDPETAYPIAGSFVARLIERHGIARLAAFFRNCSSASDRQRAFAEAFGQTLDEAAAGWAAGL